MRRRIGNLRKLASLALVALLAGCTTASPAPVRVEVPVMVPCIGEVPERPAYEFDKLPATATDGEIILALARDWPRGREYEAELEAMAAGCVSQGIGLVVGGIEYLPDFTNYGGVFPE